MADRFRLVFAGEVLEGRDRDDVQRQMGDLLRLDDARRASLFSGRRTVLRRRMRLEDATRYSARFERIGARVVVEAEPAVRPSPSAPPLTTAPARATRAAPPRRSAAPAAAGAVLLAVAGALGWLAWGGQSPLTPRVDEARIAAHGLSDAARTAFVDAYWPAAGNKAFAASPGGARGQAVAAASGQDAVQRALADCERRRAPGAPACRVVNLSGDWAAAAGP